MGPSSTDSDIHRCQAGSALRAQTELNSGWVQRHYEVIIAMCIYPPTPEAKKKKGNHHLNLIGAELWLG